MFSLPTSIKIMLWRVSVLKMLNLYNLEFFMQRCRIFSGSRFEHTPFSYKYFYVWNTGFLAWADLNIRCLGWKNMFLAKFLVAYETRWKSTFCFQTTEILGILPLDLWALQITTKLRKKRRCSQLKFKLTSKIKANDWWSLSVFKN